MTGPEHYLEAEQMWCLTLATNAVVTWTTECHGLAVTALRCAGRDVDDGPEYARNGPSVVAASVVRCLTGRPT